MEWHAVDQLGDSWQATKQLLFPIRLRSWIVVAVVVFFVSGATGFNPSINIGATEWVTIPGEVSTQVGVHWSPGDPSSIVPGTLDERSQLLIWILFLIVLGAGLLFTLIGVVLGAIFEFVFVDIARTREIRIRGFFGPRIGQGISLLAFRIGVGLIVIGFVILTVLATLITAGLFLLLLLLLSPVLVLLSIGLWILLRFTTDFVVPVMIAEDSGIINGWREFWPELRSEWKQYGVYAVVRFLLGIVAAFATGLGFAAIGLLLAIPFLFVGLIGLFVLVAAIGAEFAGLVWALFLLLIFIATLVAVGTVLVVVPIQTYLRYYSLFVLGAITPSFDVVASIRERLPTEDPASDY